jgi:hypothetical protein
VSGDLWVILFAIDGSGASNLNVPSGWSRDATWGADENNSGGSDHAARWRICDGSEGATVQFTTSDSEHSIHLSIAFVGGTFDATTPVFALRGADATTANPDPPNLNPAIGALDFTWIAGYGKDGNNTNSAFPTNYADNQLSKVSAGVAGDRCHGAMATRNLNASSENPGTFTASGSSAGFPSTLAIQPAAATTSLIYQPAPSSNYLR